MASTLPYPSLEWPAPCHILPLNGQHLAISFPWMEKQVKATSGLGPDQLWEGHSTPMQHGQLKSQHKSIDFLISDIPIYLSSQSKVLVTQKHLCYVVLLPDNPQTAYDFSVPVWQTPWHDTLAPSNCNAFIAGKARTLCRKSKPVSQGWQWESPNRGRGVLGEKLLGIRIDGQLITTSIV